MPPTPAAPEFLEDLRCTNLPPRLYRVQYEGSQAKFLGGDLVASRLRYLPTNSNDFCSRLLGHLQRRHCLKDSCFLSLFDDRQAAEEWARARYKLEDKQGGRFPQVTLYAVETELFDLRTSCRTLVFKVDELLDRFRLPSDSRTEHEYVVLNRIPAKAIGLWWDISMMVWIEEKGGTDEAKRKGRRDSIAQDSLFNDHWPMTDDVPSSKGPEVVIDNVAAWSHYWRHINDEIS